MSKILRVYALPKLVEPEELSGGTAVVIDVLRSCTTIVYALAAGARQIIPCGSVEEARATANNFPPGTVLLGGEQGGLPIDGFDLGNSPQEYTPQRVGDKTIVLATTNGTKAMLHCRSADRLLIAAFVNASAVCQQLLVEDRIHLVCAGTDGQISDDDVLLAGMLVDRIVRDCGPAHEQNAQALTARETWLHRFALPQSIGAEPLAPQLLAGELRRSLGGRNLTAIGMDADILAAAEVDRFACVPQLDTTTQAIH